jgi:hypothetical protein
MSTMATCHPESAPVPGRGVQAGIEVGGDRRGAGPDRHTRASCRGRVDLGGRNLGARCRREATVIVVVPLQGGLLGEPGRAAGLRRAGQTEGRLGCRANQGCEVSGLSVTGEEPGRTAEVPRNGAVCFRLRRSGTMAASGWPRGAFLNPLPHPGATRILRPTRAPRLVLRRQMPHSSGSL